MNVQGLKPGHFREFGWVSEPKSVAFGGIFWGVLLPDSCALKQPSDVTLKLFESVSCKERY